MAKAPSTTEIFLRERLETLRRTLERELDNAYEPGIQTCRAEMRGIAYALALETGTTTERVLAGVGI